MKWQRKPKNIIISKPVKQKGLWFEGYWVIECQIVAGTTFTIPFTIFANIKGKHYNGNGIPIILLRKSFPIKKDKVKEAIKKAKKWCQLLAYNFPDYTENILSEKLNGFVRERDKRGRFKSNKGSVYDCYNYAIGGSIHHGGAK